MSGIETYPIPDLLIRGDAVVGEGPVLDQRSARLVWVDINRGTIFEDDLVTGDQRRTSFPTLVGAVAPRRGRGFAAAVSDGFAFVEAGALTLQDRALPEPHRRMNDAKVDSSGRLWAGSTHVDYVPGSGALHRWDGRQPSVVVADGFVLPNGLGWDVDDTVMYLADSFAYRLLVASYRDGEVGRFDTFAEVASGCPDGLAVDLDGCVWLAVWGGHEIRRYGPTGDLVGVVPVPVSQPSSCAFGPDGTLYITTARDGMSTEALAAEPLSGSVFALSTPYRGVPVQPFAA